MAFQFSLAAVLRVRGIVEEREERLLQQILYEIAQATESLTTTATELMGSDASRSADLFKVFSGRHLHASYAEVEQLKLRRSELEDRIEKLEMLRDKQMIAYQAARRSREMLTDMQEEKRGAYESDVARREQKTLDDNYIARRGRF